MEKNKINKNIPSKDLQIGVHTVEAKRENDNNYQSESQQ